MAVATEIIVTASVILSTLVLSKIIRSTLVQIIKPGLVLNLLLEAVATFELCAVSFEQVLFFENFGKFAFATSLFFVTLWRTYNWRNVATSPSAHIENWFRGNISIVIVLLFVVTELLAGSIVYRYYTKAIWSFELSDTHVRKLHSTAECRTHVQINYIMASLVECGITFACGMLIRIIYTVNSLSGLTHVLKAAIITSCVMIGKKDMDNFLENTLSTHFAARIRSWHNNEWTVFKKQGFDYSGGHMNPVLATIKQYGCSGTTIFQHIFVYWIGDSAGGLLTYFVWKMSTEEKAKAS